MHPDIRQMVDLELDATRYYISRGEPFDAGPEQTDAELAARAKLPHIMVRLGPGVYTEPMTPEQYRMWRNDEAQTRTPAQARAVPDPPIPTGNPQSPRRGRLGAGL